MVGNKLNCTQEKLGETGAPMFFFSLSIFRPCFTIWKPGTGYNRRQNCWDTFLKRGVLSYPEKGSPHPFPWHCWVVSECPQTLRPAVQHWIGGVGRGDHWKVFHTFFKKEQIKPCSWDVFFPEVSQLILSPIVASYKPWAYTFLKGVLGGLYPRGLKIRGIFFFAYT